MKILITKYLKSCFSKRRTRRLCKKFFTVGNLQFFLLLSKYLMLHCIIYVIDKYITYLYTKYSVRIPAVIMRMRKFSNCNGKSLSLFSLSF